MDELTGHDLVASLHTQLVQQANLEQCSSTASERQESEAMAGDTEWMSYSPYLVVIGRCLEVAKGLIQRCTVEPESTHEYVSQ